MMAGHASNPDLDSLLQDFTPATALEFGLDLDFLNDYPEFLSDLGQMDWDGYVTSMIDDNAYDASQQPTYLVDEDPQEETLPPSEFHASAVQPQNHPLPDFPCDLNEWEVASHIANPQKPDSLFQDTVEPADLLDCAVEDLSDFFGSSGPPGYDVNGPVSGDFELPDIPQGLDVLHDLHLIGGESARSSEPSPKTEHHAVLTNPLRLSKGHQGTRRQHYVPNKAYTALDQAPKTWDIFQYTADGELDPSRLFTADEINRYLFNHPLHSDHCNTQESRLKLRVHRTPAASAKRFPNGLYCRFKDCPMGTIGQGQYLVMLDELSVEHPNHDPFLNAAYLHLWCMERYCSFEEICANLNVTAKGRDARWENGRKNRFCLGSEEECVVEDWVEACRAHGKQEVGGKPWVTNACPDQLMGCPHFDSPSLEYKGTLCHQLTVTKLHYGGQCRINLRKDREERAGYEGANITRHLGDLSKETELRGFSRCHKNQKQVKREPKTERHYRDEIREEEQAHGTKRNRDERDDGKCLGDDCTYALKKPKLRIPVWGKNPGVYPIGTPEVSPRTILAPKPQRTRRELQMTGTSPPQGGQSASVRGLLSTKSEEESEGEMDLKILAAQRRRRLLEIEDAKDREKECKLRKLRLQEACKKKRCREGGEEDGYREKRLRG